MNNTRHCLSVIFIVFLCTLNLTRINAQDFEQVEKKTLTRGKMWICCLPNGSFEKDMSMQYAWQLNYPGHYFARNEVGGGHDASRIFNVAQLGGDNVGWEWRNQRTSGHVYAIQQSRVLKNYNLINPAEPEEYIEGVIGSYKMDSEGKPHMQYELQARTMVWSFPKYDDFVLVKCTLTNTDDIAFENFYYSRTLRPNGPWNPVGATYDVEYLWDEEISEDLGFIFYDDTEWSPLQTDSTVYAISPGDVMGDRGDAGNIRIANSTDKKLYSPALYAMTFVPQSLTPNNNGERKVWRHIFGASTNAPVEDLYPGHEVVSTWSGLTQMLSAEQPHVDWREAYPDYKSGDLAGSQWERDPRYVYTIGPYDIAPGESIEWVEIFIAGQMDRNITMLGGLEATTRFVEEGLLDLKANWSAAQELMNSNFAVPGNIPPPTPADAPDIGNEYELKVESSSGMADGEEVPGVDITWKAVHLGYNDPLSGESDFAGYNIYRSDISVEGPWKLINTLTADEADALVENGEITFFQIAEMGVPYRYCVTSFDKSGNESAMTAYITEAVSAAIFASNRMENVKVIPNPFRQESGFPDQSERKRIAFINIPAKCTIRIYTVSLDLVRTVEHDGGGEATWGTSTGNNYMLTDFAMNVSPGVYIYHVESHVEGHEGDSKIGKIYIIK